MSATWALVRVFFWASLGFTLAALMPLGFALLAIGYASVYVSRQYRRAVAWTFGRAEVAASAANRRST